MENFDLQKLPLWNVFVLFLIIASNYIGELFPCKVQDSLIHNIFFKHIICFLTLLFFVVLTDISDDKKSTKQIFIQSIQLYVVFLILIRTNKLFFPICLLLLGTIYVIQLYKKYEDNDKEENSEKIKMVIKNINYYLYILFFVTLVLGFIIYMGEKKIEYKDKFKYVTFIFGKPSCRGKSPSTNLLDSFFAAFRYKG